MRIGVDFGTTRTFVALVDRGNYPVLSFTDALGDPMDFFPSVAAIHPKTGELVFGYAALDCGAPVTRSFKRALSAHDVGPHSLIRIGDRELPVLDVIVAFLKELKAAIFEAPGVIRPRGTAEEQIEAVVSVPAHAASAQRFLTLEAFRRAGFEVLAMVNEPSAAGFEFTHRQGKAMTARRDRVLVYDLGGGTFDASLVQATGGAHEVISSAGLGHLGGDDFDTVLVDCALAAAGRVADSLTPQEQADLLEEARDAKERLAPQSRKIYLSVAGDSVALEVDDFYAAAGLLIDQTLECMAPLVGVLDDEPLAGVAGIYLVGGGSCLPLVGRSLRGEFGRRVHRSPYPAASTAIGLAIAADTTSGYSLVDRLSRGFGVFRELAEGHHIGFDQIIDRDQELHPTASSESVTVTRRYRAAHNLGWYRFVEYSQLEDGAPRGGLAPFAEVRFPFDPQLQQLADDPAVLDERLREIEVVRRPDGPEVEETYTIDPHGIIEVRLRDLDTGYEQVHSLSRR